MIWPVLSFFVKYRKYWYIIAVLAAVVGFYIWLGIHDRNTIKACEARLQAEETAQENKSYKNRERIEDENKSFDHSGLVKRLSDRHELRD